jgi:hypothetical protein
MIDKHLEIDARERNLQLLASEVQQQTEQNAAAQVAVQEQRSQLVERAQRLTEAEAERQKFIDQFVKPAVDVSDEISALRAAVQVRRTDTSKDNTQ